MVSHISYLATILCAIALIQAGPALGGGRQTEHPSTKEDLNMKGFYNHNGCLYTYIGVGRFLMRTKDGHKINETLHLNMLDFDASRSKCTNVTKGELIPGRLTFSYKLKSKVIRSVIISMTILPDAKKLMRRFWEVSEASLSVFRGEDKKRVFRLKLPDHNGGIYAGTNQSYSCAGIAFQTIKGTEDNATARLIFERFQLQPFAERQLYVFAESRDCSTWMTIPGLTGLLLILFMLAVTVVSTILLKSIETNDFKFTKEGLQFTQSQQETNKAR